jgi:hypothetical protein
MSTRHPAWCAAGHRCGLGEHRAHPHRFDADRMVLTRVQSAGGEQYAEVRIRLPLSGDERVAVGQLARLVQLLRAVGVELRGPERRPIGASTPMARDRAAATTK